MRPFAVALLLAFSSLSVSAAPKPKAPTSEVVILAGGQSDEEAKAALEKIKPVFQSFVPDAKGFPKIVKSDEYEGLKPGFTILVAGFCEKKADAHALRDLFNASGLEGVYTRTVKGTFPDACPRLSGTKYSVGKWTEDEEQSLDTGEPSFTMRLLTQAVTRPKDCTATSVRIVVELSGREYDGESFEGSCTPPRYEGDLGSSKSYSGSIRTDRFIPYVSVTSEEWMFDTPLHETRYYVWTRSGLTSSEDLEELMAEQLKLFEEEDAKASSEITSD